LFYQWQEFDNCLNKDYVHTGAMAMQAWVGIACSVLCQVQLHRRLMVAFLPCMKVQCAHGKEPNAEFGGGLQ